VYTNSRDNEVLFTSNKESEAMPAKGLVSISLLCYNSMTYLPKTLAAIGQQTYPYTELIIIDNCSTDGTVDYLKQNHSSVQLILNESNTGYCRGHNQGIQASNGEFVLVLNPDVLITPTFIEKMVDAALQDSQIGIVSGKLVQIGRSFDILESQSSPIIDSTGLSGRPNGRFVDRGAGQIDHGQYDEMAYVFGACGAAALLRRTMLEEIAFEGQYFDEDFFIGQEDADLSWRTQIAGWKAIYVPNSVAYHVRFIRPSSYAELPRWQRIHSMKNRFMLRIKNMSVQQFLIQALPMLSWDIVVLGYTLLRQPYALQGLWFLAKLMQRNLRKRGFINHSRKVSDQYIRQWFSWKDVSKSMGIPDSMPRRQLYIRI
jgi:GT2 family glycosyltransferase